MDLAVEGITEVTYEINRLYPQRIQEGIALLPVAQQTRLQLLLREFQGDENLPNEMRVREAALSLERVGRVARDVRDTPRSVSNVLGEFVGADTVRSSRGFPIIHGTFTLFNPDGSEIDNFDVNTGGGSPSYRTTNGPVPPGVYRVSNHRPDRTTDGMVLNGVGYSFDVDPTDGTQVFGRSLFRIHPDGGNIGTNGCLCVRENAARLRACEDTIEVMSREGAFKMVVRY